MISKQILLNAISLTIAVCAVGLTKANPPVPDYYINNAAQCVEAPVTQCFPGDPTCFAVIQGQGTTPKAIFDIRTSSGVCQSQLEQLTIQ